MKTAMNEVKKSTESFTATDHGRAKEAPKLTPERAEHG